jgi:hypothetical protein
VPIHYAIDVVRGLVRVEMTGAVGATDTLAFLERLGADPALRRAMPQLVDLRGVAAPPTAAESESVAQGFARLRHRFEGVRCAVVVHDPLAFGAIRQFAALAVRAAVEVRPFLDEREAERWLGLPEVLQ